MPRFGRSIGLSTLILLSALDHVTAQPYQPAATGQQRCLTGIGAEMSCGDSGLDAGWLAGTLWSSSRFSDNGDGTLTDTLTGLIWLVAGLVGPLATPIAG